MATAVVPSMEAIVRTLLHLLVKHGGKGLIIAAAIVVVIVVVIETLLR